MTDTDPSDAGVETTRRRLRKRSEEIRRRELDEALSRLDAKADLTDEQRTLLRELSLRISEQIIAAPDAHLATATDREGPGVKPIVRLFDLEGLDSLQTHR